MTSIIKVDQIQNAAGTTGLTIDSGGVVLKPNVPAFLANKTATQTNAAMHETVTWAELFDATSDFNNNVFTCPVDGIYFFSCPWLSNSTTTQTDVALYKNNVVIQRSRNAVSGGHETTTLNYVGSFNANDTVHVGFSGVAGSQIYGDSNGHWSTFMGHLIG